MVEESPPASARRSSSQSHTRPPSMRVRQQVQQSLHGDISADTLACLHLAPSKLRHYLDHFGEFPARYRALIWRHLLQLPEQRVPYENLLSLGQHPAYRLFKEQYPLKSSKLAVSTDRILSLLAHWCPLFADLDYLPAMVFPFVKVFAPDTFSCFEALITLLLNYCQKWWEYYPNVPIECLEMVEDLLAYHDPQLFHHYMHYRIPSQVYAWMLMQTVFSEVFRKEHWLRVWDHIVVNDPSFMYCLVIAYLKYFRVALFNITRVDKMKEFNTKMHPLSCSSLLALAYTIHKTTPAHLSPSTVIHAFQPLPHTVSANTSIPFSSPRSSPSRQHRLQSSPNQHQTQVSNTYPLFDQYPVFLVNYQSNLRERILREEEEYLHRRHVSDDMTRLKNRLDDDHRRWELSDWKMSDMLEKWWQKVVKQEDEHLNAQYYRDSDLLATRAKNMESIADARAAFIAHQVNSTARRTEMLSHAAEATAHFNEQNERTKNIREDFDHVEREWKLRWKQMQLARKDMEKAEQLRMEKLVQLISEKKGYPIDNRKSPHRPTSTQHGNNDDDDDNE